MGSSPTLGEYQILFCHHIISSLRKPSLVKIKNGSQVARLAQSVQHGTLNIIESRIPGSWVRAPRWAKIKICFCHHFISFLTKPSLVKVKSGSQVARLAQSVEHGTLNIIGSGIPGSWNRAPRWANIKIFFAITLSLP